ncbi:MAG: transcriptional regulator, partial [Myxococcales bacterium]|nr:transcriptional regulator [Myxococcales bacterium]
EPGLDAAPEPEPIPDAATPGRDAGPGPFPDAGPDRGATIPPAPVPGWSGLVPEDEAGCRQSDAPIPAATLGLLLVLAWRRRRRC